MGKKSEKSNNNKQTNEKDKILKKCSFIFAYRRFSKNSSRLTTCEIFFRDEKEHAGQKKRLNESRKTLSSREKKCQRKNEK